MTSKQIWLFRHGATAWSITGQHTGRTDLPLLPEGEARAAAMAPRVRDHAFALVLSSPLQRARRTAELIGLNNIELEPNLMEFDYGAYEGKTLEEIRRKVPGWTLWTHPSPGGETLEQAAARTRKVLTRATAAGGDVALVAHGHILRILAACWLGFDPAQGQHFALSTGTISILGYENDITAFLHWNMP